MRHLALFASVLSLAALGCTAQTEEPIGPVGEFADGQGQLATDLPDYPNRADWGLDVENVIPDWSFIGYANAEDPNLSGMQLIRLSDFYNPHGYDYADCVKGGATDCATKFPDAVFPKGSPWGEGQPKPRALSIGQSAVWCGPCNIEAKSILPGKAAKYQPLGGQFFVGLVDGPKPGSSATYLDITNWTKKYNVPYPLVTDPNGFLPQLFPPSLPSNAVIRTYDMRILLVAAGAPEDPESSVCKQFPNEPACKFFPTFEKALESAN